MNKPTIIAIIMLLNFSCVSSQEKEQVVEETTILQQTTPFNQLEVKSIDKVILEQGTTPSIAIIKGSEYQSLLEINTLNGKLTINKKQTKDKKLKNKQIYLKITYTNLNQISLINLGSVLCENAINSKDLNIETQNTANVNFNIICDNLNLTCSNSANIVLTGQSKISDIDVKNSANLDFSIFKVEELNLTAKNGANGKINTSGKLSILLENYALFTVKGNPTIIKKEIKNVANFKM
ncbi:MAG: DUF2807 domain-containing protein [Flavobacteriales bacterium]|jgi:hypothetical protein|nr:MAG: hypothetical protein F9K09_02730 [Flavobacteriales bacterium]MBE7442430.1 DUF2807 domain-containing protein [Flavobacteriales bacterium]MBX2959916.1 DUF2807 domain-containing protein [Flavobacteriales bacterium]MCL4856995.1 DUF2807 domain-containing protein [Flavobacteriales bacterium]